MVDLSPLIVRRFRQPKFTRRLGHSKESWRQLTPNRNRRPAFPRPDTAGPFLPTKSPDRPAPCSFFALFRFFRLIIGWIYTMATPERLICWWLPQTTNSSPDPLSVVSRGGCSGACSACRDEGWQKGSLSQNESSPSPECVARSVNYARATRDHRFIRVFGQYGVERVGRMPRYRCWSSESEPSYGMCSRFSADTAVLLRILVGGTEGRPRTLPSGKLANVRGTESEQEIGGR